MTEELISFEIAKLAKEIRFDVKVTTYYYDNQIDGIRLGKGAKQNYNNFLKVNKCSAPTQSLLQKWLKEIKLKYVELFFTFDKEAPYAYRIIDLTNDNFAFLHNCEELKRYESPEEALEYGILETLKLIEDEE